MTTSYRKRQKAKRQFRTRLVHRRTRKVRSIFDLDAFRAHVADTVRQREGIPVRLSDILEAQR